MKEQVIEYIKGNAELKSFFESAWRRLQRQRTHIEQAQLDYLDEEDIIGWVCANEDYGCIGDLCMGRGLVAVNAYKNGKKFVGTDLNHKRLSVTVEKIIKSGGQISG
jgi:hypothetical protein